MKKTILAVILSVTALATIQAQSQKIPVYAHLAMGYGNTFFYGTLAEKETRNDQRGYGRNQGFTLSTFFYVSPESWKGLGIGSGVKGFFATPNNGDNNETYLFNYYHVGVGLKYYPFSKTFNKGFCVKSNVGFGQMTEKTKFNTTKIYEHQFAIGTTLLGGLGYALPLGKNKTCLTVEFEAEYANRKGDVSGKGEDQSFQNSHISLNVGIGF
ncbi:MAG: hypothetical protein H7Y04_16635 [Verrucomicrobia bacterium]|nr:hypothetical protein [Cytophagales bacterium]